MRLAQWFAFKLRSRLRRNCYCLSLSYIANYAALQPLLVPGHVELLQLVVSQDSSSRAATKSNHTNHTNFDDRQLQVAAR